MLFQRVNRSDAEKVFVAVKNNSGATLTANYPAYWDVEMTTPDGVSVTNSATSTTLQSFAGIADQSIANGGYGLVQVYGYRSTVQIYSSTGSSAKGDNLTVVNGAVSGLVPAATGGTVKAWGFLCAAVTASSSSQFGTTAACFLRAL